MINEKDYIDKIFDSDSEKGGMIKKESEFYNEFTEFGEKKEVPEKTTIISFVPLHYKEEKTENLTVKFAAMSKSPDISQKPDSFFYYHKAKNVALKIDVKNSNQIFASVIAEAGADLDEALLYCKETKKYFLLDDVQTYYLGNYEHFDATKFNFDLIFPKDVITIVSSESGYNFISKSGVSYLEKLLPKKDETELTLIEDSGFTVSILKSGSYKDFVYISDNKILIPNVLLENKMKLILY